MKVLTWGVDLRNTEVMKSRQIETEKHFTTLLNFCFQGVWRQAAIADWTDRGLGVPAKGSRRLRGGSLKMGTWVGLAGLGDFSMGEGRILEVTCSHCKFKTLARPLGILLKSQF